MAPAEQHIDKEQADLRRSENLSKISELRKLIKDDALLGQFTYDDSFLLKFLRARDCNIKDTFTLLTAYVKKVQERPDLFTWNDDLRKVLDAGIHRVCKSRRPDGGAIALIRVKNWNPSEIDANEVFQLIITADETEALDEKIQEHGVHTIIDASDVSLYQIYRFGVTNGRFVSELGEKVLPWRVRKIHIIFENRLVDIGYNLFKPFLSDEFKERICFHGKNLDALKACCPLSCLPPDFFGTCKDDYSTEERLERFRQHRSVLEKLWNQFKTTKAPESL